jgi:alpha-aminoadipate carrier protein LysW
VVKCPDCGTAMDLDEDEVEEGEILSCPECEVELEVVQKHPVRLNSLAEEDEEEEDEELLDEEEDLEDEELEEDEEEEA